MFAGRVVAMEKPEGIMRDPTTVGWLLSLAMRKSPQVAIKKSSLVAK
jgi:hypothetical protein